MGSDTTELEFSVESTSFMNRVNDQVRKRQKRISNVTGTFYYLVNVYGCNNEISSIHGKEFPKTAVIPLRIPQISHSNKCLTYLRNWCQNKMRSQVWRRLIGKNIHGNFCH